MEPYIKKADIVAEIEKRLKANGAFDEMGDAAWWEDKGMCDAYKSILSFLDTLEVKEVDLDEEFDRYCENLYVIDIQEAPFTEMYDCAKYFFELGLKAQKGK